MVGSRDWSFMETGAVEAYFGTTIPDELFFQESTRSD